MTNTEDPHLDTPQPGDKVDYHYTHKQWGDLIGHGAEVLRIYPKSKKADIKTCCGEVFRGAEWSRLTVISKAG